MRAFVFTDKALERYAGQFVWRAVDTENSTNSGFLKKYPISVWPTLLIIDPKKEAVALRYAGGATVPQLEKLLSDGQRVVRGTKSKADEEIARADRLANEGKHAEAAKAYDEAIAAAPKTPEQRAVFDSHRVTAYMALKQPERAIPMLEQSERDLPNDYNPPARLGVIYRTMGKYDEALAAYDRALAKAYGPRKIGILRGKADTYAQKGDKEAAKKTIEEAIRFAESLPEGQRSDSTIASLKKRLETI